MGDVKRYSPDTCAGALWMESDERGEYVKYEDYAKLEAELSALRAGQQGVQMPDGWKVERDFDVLPRPFSFVDNKSHLPTIKIILPACAPDDMDAFDVRDQIAESVRTFLAALKEPPKP